MHVDPDAVAHKIPNHREPLGLDHPLHGCADVAQGRPRPHRRNARVERRFRHRQQPRGVRIDRTHRHRDRRVPEVAVHHHPKIQRNDVPFLQDPLGRRYTMHHLAVH